MSQFNNIVRTKRKKILEYVGGKTPCTHNNENQRYVTQTTPIIEISKDTSNVVQYLLHTFTEHLNKNLIKLQVFRTNLRKPSYLQVSWTNLIKTLITSLLNKLEKTICIKSFLELEKNLSLSFLHKFEKTLFSHLGSIFFQDKLEKTLLFTSSLDKLDKNSHYKSFEQT